MHSNKTMRLNIYIYAFTDKHKKKNVKKKKRIKYKAGIISNGRCIPTWCPRLDGLGMSTPLLVRQTAFNFSFVHSVSFYIDLGNWWAAWWNNRMCRALEATDWYMNSFIGFYLVCLFCVCIFSLPIWTQFDFYWSKFSNMSKLIVNLSLYLIYEIHKDAYYQLRR